MPRNDPATSTSAPTQPPRPPKPPTPTKELELRASLVSIRDISQKLNALSDVAAKTIQQVETYLNEVCSTGVTAYVQFEAVDEEGPAGKYLEYRRVGQKFRIAIVYTDANAQDVEVKAWSDSTREDKLDSFEKLPELLDVLAGKLREVLNNTERTLVPLLEVVSNNLPPK